MSGIEKPIYLVALRDTWVSHREVSDSAILAFGTRGSAEDFAKGCAKERGLPASLFRIVEFRSTGNVFEA